MNASNTGTLRGHVVRDPKIFSGPKSRVAKFTVEIPRENGNSRDYVPVTAFGDHVKDVERWLQPGSEVAIKYTLQSSRREVDGKTTYPLDPVLEHLAVLSGSKAPVVQDAATPAA